MKSMMSSYKDCQHYDLTIDLENRIVKKNGINIELTLKEYELLEVFARNPQKVFSREELLQKAWGMILWVIPEQWISV